MTSTLSARSLNVSTYKLALYEQIGTMMSELATAFQVSKTPVREALLLLEADGLVKLQPHQGATVTMMSMSEYEELLFIQDALEQSSLPHVIDRISDGQLDLIDQDVHRAVVARQRGDSRECFVAGVAVHRALFGVLGFGRMSRILDGILAWPTRRYERALVHPIPEAWDAEIRVLTDRVDFVRRRDAPGALDAVRAGRAAMLELARQRALEPEVMSYFVP
jgi:DNA-binding GntR family transcriptional regulator